MTISTVSRRQMLASIPAAMTRGAAVALSATPEVTVDDPVIGRHRAARQVTQAPSGLRTRPTHCRTRKITRSSTGCRHRRRHLR
jgi:hypothetical protein